MSSDKSLPEKSGPATLDSDGREPSKAAAAETLVEFFRRSPLVGTDIDLTRDNDAGKAEEP
jgi:hypothetical protein